MCHNHCLQHTAIIRTPHAHRLYSPAPAHNICQKMLMPPERAVQRHAMYTHPPHGAFSCAHAPLIDCVNWRPRALVRVLNQTEATRVCAQTPALPFGCSTHRTDTHIHTPHTNQRANRAAIIGGPGAISERTRASSSCDYAVCYVKCYYTWSYAPHNRRFACAAHRSGSHKICIHFRLLMQYAFRLLYARSQDRCVCVCVCYDTACCKINARTPRANTSREYALADRLLMTVSRPPTV